QRLQEEVQGQAKAATELQTKLQAAQAEQQQQARAVADADSKRKAAEAEQQRLKEEAQRQTKAASDADTKRRGPRAEKPRLTEELRTVGAKAATKQVALPQATSTVMAPSVQLRPDVQAVDQMLAGSDRNSTAEACQEKCIQSGKCQAFTFAKTLKLCFLYDLMPNFRSDTDYVSGVLKR